MHAKPRGITNRSRQDSFREVKMIDFSRAKADVLIECKSDHVGLWVVIWHVCRLFKEMEPSERRRIALELLRELLEEHQIMAGFPTADGRDFESWSLTPDET